MKQKISVALAAVLCLSLANFSAAQEIKQPNAENKKEQSPYYAEAVDPDPGLVILLGTEQENIQYKELPEEQEQIAVIPGNQDFAGDQVSTKIVPEGELDIAVQPPQVRIQ